MENTKVNLRIQDMVTPGTYSKSIKYTNCTSQRIFTKDHNDTLVEIPVSTTVTSRRGELTIQTYDGKIGNELVVGDTIVISEEELRNNPVFVSTINCIVGLEHNIEKIVHPAATSGYEELLNSANHDAIMARVGTGLSYNLFIDPDKVDNIRERYYIQRKDYPMPITIRPHVLSLDGCDMKLEISENRPKFNDNGEVVLGLNGQPEYHNVSHTIKSVPSWEGSGCANVIELLKERSFIVVSDNKDVCIQTVDNLTSEMHSKYSSLTQANVEMQTSHDKEVQNLKDEFKLEADKLNKTISTNNIDTQKLKEQIASVESERDEYKVIIGTYKATEAQEQAKTMAESAEKIAKSKESVASSNSSGAASKASSVTWQAWAAMGATGVTVIGGVVIWVVKTSTVAALAASGISAITAAACAVGLCCIPAVVNSVVSVLSDVVDVVCDVVSGVWDIACDIVENVVDTVSSVVSTVVDTVCSIGETIVDTVSSAVSGVCNFVGGLFSW